MKTCIDKTCEAVLCEECNDLKPSMCGDRGLQFPKDACDVITFEGVEDVETKQGLCVDLTEGVHAYDGDGTEISYTVEPSEIGCCDVGEHEVTYTAVGKGTKMLPSFCLGKPMLTTADCGLMTKVVTRVITILQSLPPKIIGAVRTVIPVGATFDPLEGVSGIDDNGKATEVTYEGRYDETTGMVDIASVESDIEQNAKHLYVELEPQQDCTPWMGTEKDTTPYVMRAVDSIGQDVGNTQYDTLVGGTVNWIQLASTSSISTPQTVEGVTFTKGANGSWNVMGTATGRVQIFLFDRFYTVPGHKYLVNISKNIAPLRLRENNGSIGQTAVSAVLACAEGKNTYFTFDSAVDIAGTTFNLSDVYVNIFDLTAMLGSQIADYIYSLEQANAGAGVAWFKEHFAPNDYYPYDVGTLKSVQTSGHKVVGFNQWDEEWDNVLVNINNGNTAPSAITIGSKNFCPILPSTAYYATCGKTDGDSQNRYYLGLIFYDENKQYVSGGYYNNRVFTTPKNARFFKITTNTSTVVYGSTYNNDICINIS